MNKARLIAVSAVCSAAALVCLIVANYLYWLGFMLAVVASVAVCVPMLIDEHAGVYSFLCYIVASVFGVWLGIGNIGNVLPLVAFAMPFAMLKVFAETKVADSQGVVRTRLKPVVRWLLYYLLLEVAMGLTVGAMFLFTRPVVENLIETKALYYIIGIVNVALPIYNIVATGCLKLAVNSVRKVYK